MDDLHQELVDELIEQIKSDAVCGDYTILEALLKSVPKEAAVTAIIDEDRWEHYRPLTSTPG